MSPFLRLALPVLLTAALLGCSRTPDEVSSLQRADFVTASTWPEREKASFTERCRRVASDARACGCLVERYAISTRLDRIFFEAALRRDVGMAMATLRQAEKIGLGRAELQAALDRSKQKVKEVKAACSA